MTRREALDFVKAFEEGTGFRYGDLSYVTEKQDAIKDIELMDDELWNDGDIFEAQTSDEGGTNVYNTK